MWMPPSGFWYQLLTRWQCHIRELAHILHLCPTVTLCCYSLQGTTDMRTILWVICLIFSPMGDLWVSHWWCLVVLCLIRLGFMNKSLLSTVYPQRTAYDLYDNLRGLHWLNNPIHWQNYFPGTLHSCVRIWLGHCGLLCLISPTIFFYILFCLFGHAHSMWKFPGQGWNPSYSSEDAESLTTRPPGNSPNYILNWAKESLHGGFIVLYCIVYSSHLM